MTTCMMSNSGAAGQVCLLSTSGVVGGGLGEQGLKLILLCNISSASSRSDVERMFSDCSKDKWIDRWMDGWIDD